MSGSTFRHDLYVYDDDGAFADRVVPFLADGIDAGEAVLAVLGADSWDLLRDGVDPAGVTFIDREGFYTRPLAALATYDATLRRLVRDGAPGVRVVGQLPRCETPAEWDAWVAYEAILNRAFADRPAWLTCAYDARTVPESVVEGARRTHPPHVADLAEVMRELEPELEPLLEPLPQLPIDGDPHALRVRLRAEMAAAGVPEAEARAMLAAAGEVFENARRHGGGARTLRAGRVGDRFVCELSDRGPGLDDPFAGYVPPRPSDVAGAGLWVARQLTRRLELLPSADGLTARLWV